MTSIAPIEQQRVPVPPEHLLTILKGFLPAPFLPTIGPADDEYLSKCKTASDVLQYFIDKTDGKLGLFGSATSLCQDLALYQKFPASCLYFDFKPYEPHRLDVMLLWNLDRTHRFINKVDVLFCIYKHIAPVGIATRINGSVASMFLNFHAKKLAKTCEFVPFSDEIELEMVREIQKYTREIEYLPYSIPTVLSAEEIVGTYSKILKLCGVHAKYTHCCPDAVRAILKQEDFGAWENPEYWLNTFARCYVMLKSVQKYISEHPETFLPFDLLNAEKRDIHPICIRNLALGPDDGLVFMDELLGSLDRQAGCPAQLDKFERDLITASFSAVPEMIGKLGFSMEQFEFLHYPIERTKTVPVPIQTFTGSFCYLVMDAHFLFYRQLFAVCQIWEGKNIAQDAQEWTDRAMECTPQTGHHFMEIEVANTLFDEMFQDILAKSYRRPKIAKDSVNFEDFFAKIGQPCPEQLRGSKKLGTMKPGEFEMLWNSTERSYREWLVQEKAYMVHSHTLRVSSAGDAPIIPPEVDDVTLRKIEMDKILHAAHFTGWKVLPKKTKNPAKQPAKKAPAKKAPEPRAPEFPEKQRPQAVDLTIGQLQEFFEKFRIARQKANLIQNTKS